MPAAHYIVATAGHVDHGKSSLVKALTGIDPDRLPEEKARGITIDLGFAHLELPAPSTLDSPFSTGFSLGIVDVPGHEDFVKNMVAGVGSIDLALFVVAADDGWMPQTEEHLQILAYLGVRHAVVALTKIDLVEGRETAVIDSVRQELRGSPFAEAVIVPTSVTDGRGLSELKAALSAVLANIPPPRDVGKPRLSIDRVFTLHGVGTVVTGTLTGGVLRRNQAVAVQPSGKSTRIRTLQSHNYEVEQAVPSTRTALSLPDLAVASATGDSVQRGQVVTLAELGEGTTTVDVLLERSARLRDEKSGPGRPLKDGALVRIHHGSANAPARLRLAGGQSLLAGGQALARLHLEQPLFLLGGDRFILRDWPEQTTLAGGLALDVDAQGHRFADAEQQRLLHERAGAHDDVAVWLSTQLVRDRAMRRNALLARTRFSPDAIRDAAEKLVGVKTAIGLNEWVMSAAWWNELLARAKAAVNASHAAHPERTGLALSELRASLERYLPASELFDLLVAELCRSEFAQAGGAIRHQSHRMALPPHLQSAGSKLRAALALKPFEPPSRKELTPDSPSQQALRFLLETGEAVEVGPEIVMSGEAFARARELVKKFFIERGEGTASDVRQFLNTNRRVVIPLLEKLDKDGVTQRRGDVRVLRTK